MKITARQLRAIIKEEAQRAKFEKLVREVVQQEMLDEGFLDKVKGVFGKGMENDASKLIAGVKMLVSRMAGTAPDLEQPKSTSDFLGKAVNDSPSGRVNWPGKKGKAFSMYKIASADAGLPKQLDDLKKNYGAGKLNDDKFEQEVEKLVGIPRAGWSEFPTYARALVDDALARSNAVAKGEKEAYEMGQEKDQRKKSEELAMRKRIAAKLGLKMDDMRVDAAMDRERGLDDDKLKIG